jgi:hypothetical protein
MLGIGRRIGHLLAAFLLGAALGLVVFYWFAEYAFDFGVIIMDFISVIKTLIFSLIICALFFLITFIFYKNKRPKISIVNYFLFGMGWLLAIALTIVFYPGYDRYFKTPKAVQQQAQVLEKQLAEYPILWEVGMNNPRENVRFELKPKGKGIGYMPSSAFWYAEWYIRYKDSSSVTVTFFLNGVEPARIYSVGFDYSNTEAWWQLPDAEAYQVKNPDNKLLLTLPWAHFESSINAVGNTEIIATYPDGVQLRWERSQDERDAIRVEKPNMKPACQIGWTLLKICVPPKPSQAVPPGLLLY